MLLDETDKNAFSLKIDASFRGFLCWFSYSLIFLKNRVFKTHKGVFCALTPSSNPKLNPPNPLRSRYEKTTRFSQAFLFWLSKHPKAFFKFHDQHPKQS
ncbi:hypothetical protein HPHPH30_0335 [Helicobacter pylori Hp H-30]|nr:hypothetical protein HPHPH30_0335 [Helicobacter pylori Hp H-30]